MFLVRLRDLHSFKKSENPSKHSKSKKRCESSAMRKDKAIQASVHQRVPRSNKSSK